MKTAHINKILILLILAGLLASGCSTAGKKFDTARVQDIKKGATTKSDIISMFGAPLRKETSPRGEVWAYSYVSSHVTGAGAVGNVFVGVNQSKTSCDSLELVFDGDVVKDFRCSQGEHVDTYIQ